MKYIPLHGQLCKLYGNTHPYTDNPVNYMKYTPLQRQHCKLYEIHTLTGATLKIITL